MHAIMARLGSIMGNTIASQLQGWRFEPRIRPFVGKLVAASQCPTVYRLVLQTSLLD